MTQPAMLTTSGATTPEVWRVTIPGDPAPKGSMKCVGRRGKAMHVLVEDDKSGRGKKWRKTLTEGCATLATHIGAPINQPVTIGALFVVPRPAAAKGRALPHLRSSGVGGDTDKLARMILDAATDAGLLADDSRVVALLAFKVYETDDRPVGVQLYVTTPGPGRAGRVLDAILRTAPELDQLT